VRLVLGVWALTGLAGSGVFAVLFNLYLLRLGHGPEFIGLISAVGSVAHALCCPVAGALGVRWGSRRLMLAGMSLGAMGSILIPLADFVPVAWEPAWVLVAMMFSRLGYALSMVNSTPFLTAATGPAERTYVFSIQSAVMPLTGFAGSLVGGLLPGIFAGAAGLSLQDPAPYRYALLLAALLLIPTVPMLLATRQAEGRREEGRATERGPAPFVLMSLLTLVMILRWAGRGPTVTFFNVYLDAELKTSTAMIGMLTAIGNLVAVPSALVMPLVVARWGLFRTLVCGSAGMVVCLLPLALVPHWAAAGFGFIGTLALFGITSPTITVLSQEMVTPGWRPAMSGVMNMSVGLGTAAMALGGGYAIASLGYRTVFLASAGFMATGTLLFWAYFRVPRGELAKK